MTIRLVQTCYAFPEQYDAFDGDKQVGYLRLRHGFFTVECPDTGGKLVYESQPDGDGMFEAEERSKHLDAAVLAIENWMLSQVDRGRPKYTIQALPDPEAQYNHSGSTNGVLFPVKHHT